MRGFNLREFISFSDDFMGERDVDFGEFSGGEGLRCGWGSDVEFEKRTVEPHESERFVRRWR